MLYLAEFSEAFMSIFETDFYPAERQVFERGIHFSSLAISSSEEDISFLESRFNDASWTLYTAHTCREALAQLTRCRVPVVLCESELPDSNWKDVLGQVAHISERSRLIVFSRHADEGLWAEVLNLGVFDLLATPFRDEELVFTIGSAWLDWKADQKRHSPGNTRTHKAFTQNRQIMEKVDKVNAAKERGLG